MNLRNVGCRKDERIKSRGEDGRWRGSNFLQVNKKKTCGRATALRGLRGTLIDFMTSAEPRSSNTAQLGMLPTQKEPLKTPETVILIFGVFYVVMQS